MDFAALRQSFQAAVSDSSTRAEFAAKLSSTIIKSVSKARKDVMQDLSRSRMDALLDDWIVPGEGSHLQRDHADKSKKSREAEISAAKRRRTSRFVAAKEVAATTEDEMDLVSWDLLEVISLLAGLREGPENHAALGKAVLRAIDCSLDKFTSDCEMFPACEVHDDGSIHEVSSRPLMVPMLEGLWSGQGVNHFLTLAEQHVATVLQISLNLVSGDLSPDDHKLVLSLFNKLLRGDCHATGKIDLPVKVSANDMFFASLCMSLVTFACALPTTQSPACYFHELLEPICRVLRVQSYSLMEEDGELCAETGMAVSPWDQAISCLSAALEKEASRPLFMRMLVSGFLAAEFSPVWKSVIFECMESKYYADMFWKLSIVCKPLFTASWDSLCGVTPDTHRRVWLENHITSEGTLIPPKIVPEDELCDAFLLLALWAKHNTEQWMMEVQRIFSSYSQLTALLVDEVSTLVEWADRFEIESHGRRFLTSVLSNLLMDQATEDAEICFQILASDWHPTSPLIGVALDCAPFVVANPLIRSLDLVFSRYSSGVLPDEQLTKVFAKLEVIMSSSSLERTCLRSFAQTSILLHFGNFMKLVCTSNQHASPLHCQLVRSAVTLLSLCLPLAACHARASSTSTGLCNSTTICHQYILHLSKDVCQQTFMGDSDVNRTWTNGRKTDLLRRCVAAFPDQFPLVVSSFLSEWERLWQLEATSERPQMHECTSLLERNEVRGVFSSTHGNHNTKLFRPPREEEESLKLQKDLKNLKDRNTRLKIMMDSFLSCLADKQKKLGQSVLLRDLFDRTRTWAPISSEDGGESVPWNKQSEFDTHYRELLRRDSSLVSLMPMVADHPDFIDCFFAVRSLLFASLCEWKSMEKKIVALEHPKKLYTTLIIIRVLREARWLPEPLASCGELLEHLNSADIVSVLTCVWQYLSRFPAGSTPRAEVPQSYIHNIRSVLVANITSVAHVYYKWA